MEAMAVGVKGRLRRRRESLVVCACRREEESCRRERALGGWGLLGGGGECGRADWRVWRRVVRVARGVERGEGEEVEGSIAGIMVW